MKNLTYRQLLQKLNELRPHQLDCNVTVYIPRVEEYYPVESFKLATSVHCDVLDAGHPYMVVQCQLHTTLKSRCLPEA